MTVNLPTNDLVCWKFHHHKTALGSKKSIRCLEWYLIGTTYAMVLKRDFDVISTRIRCILFERSQLLSLIDDKLSDDKFISETISLITDRNVEDSTKWAH